VHAYIYVYTCAHIYKCEDMLERIAHKKLQVSFAEYSLFYRTLLQKRPLILYVCVPLHSLSAAPTHKHVNKKVYMYIYIFIHIYV